MKKLMITFYFLTILILISSCKKEIQNEPELSTISNKVQYEISPMGHLVFSSTQSFMEFAKKMLNPYQKQNTLSELKKLGFKNRRVNSSELSRSSNSVYNLIFNEEGILQVENVIMKITDDDRFIYTLKEEMSNTESYSKLLQEVYDGLIMNKINVDRNLEEEFNFINFMSDNPFGVLETLYSENGKRPMFGSIRNNWSHTTEPTYNAFGVCVSYTTEFSQTTTYILWVGFPGAVQIGNTVTNYNVLGCN